MNKDIFECEDKNGNYLMWLVSDLWSASKSLPIKKLPIELFEQKIQQWINFTTKQVNDKTIAYLDVDHFQRIRNADLKYPIILNADGSYVMDGMHRLLKVWLSGMTHVKVVQFEKDPRPKYTIKYVE